MHRHLTSTALFVIVLAVALPARQETKPLAFPDAVLGRWDLTIQGVDGAYPSWLKVHQRTDDQLQAEFVGRFGSVRHASVTRFLNDQLIVVVPVQYEDMKVELVFLGKLAGNDRLEGTTIDEKGRPITWTAARAPASTPTKTVTWGAPVPLRRTAISSATTDTAISAGVCAPMSSPMGAHIATTLPPHCHYIATTLRSNASTLLSKGAALLSKEATLRSKGSTLAWKATTPAIKRIRIAINSVHGALYSNHMALERVPTAIERLRAALDRLGPGGGAPLGEIQELPVKQASAVVPLKIPSYCLAACGKLALNLWK
jgi:hypothetical protein